MKKQKPIETEPQTESQTRIQAFLKELEELKKRYQVDLTIRTVNKPIQERFAVDAKYPLSS